jgi:hypothetical protein
MPPFRSQRDPPMSCGKLGMRGFEERSEPDNMGFISGPTCHNLLQRTFKRSYYVVKMHIDVAADVGDG